MSTECLFRVRLRRTDAAPITVGRPPTAESLRAGGYCRSVATNELPLGDHSSSSYVLVGPMTRLEAAADDRRGRAFVRQGIRELGELAEPTVDFDCATLPR